MLLLLLLLIHINDLTYIPLHNAVAHYYRYIMLADDRVSQSVCLFTYNMYCKSICHHARTMYGTSQQS